MNAAQALLLFAAAGVAGCGQRSPATASHATDAAQSWWQWHDDVRAVDRAVDEAINEPGGGNYVKAVEVVRSSDFPPAVKQFQVGQLIIGGITERADKRPPETMEQGLRMMEDASIAPGQKSEANVQQLRFLFERGAGTPPAVFPKDPEVAACWLRVEQRRTDDRARCIALRRQRLPNVGR